MKVLIDVNLSLRWTFYLRKNGIEGDHWSTLGPNDAADVEIITYARQNHCIILTRDLDFGAHLFLNRASKPSVVQLRADRVTPEAVGSVVATTLHRLSVDLEQGAIVTIDLKRVRVSLLPLG